MSYVSRVLSAKTPCLEACRSLVVFIAITQIEVWAMVMSLIGTSIVYMTIVVRRLSLSLPRSLSFAHDSLAPRCAVRLHSTHQSYLYLFHSPSEESSF